MKSTSSIDPALTEIAARALQDPSEFGGLALFPLFHVTPTSAEYWVLDDAEMVEVPVNINRAPGAAFSRSLTKLSGDKYNCKHYGHEEPVSDEESSKYARKGAALESATRRVSNVLLINHELRVKAMATSAEVPTSVVVVKWDDGASAPVDDVKTARRAIHDGCAHDANVMIVSRSVYEVLKEHPAIKAMIKISSEDSRWPQMLARLFDVERFVVAKALVTNSKEGQVISVSDVWGDSVILAHVDSLEDLKAVSFGRTFITADEETPSGVTVEVYRQEKAASDIVRARQATDEKLTAPSAGFHLSDVLSI